MPLVPHCLMPIPSPLHPPCPLQLVLPYIHSLPLNTCCFHCNHQNVHLTHLIVLLLLLHMIGSLFHFWCLVCRTTPSSPPFSLPFPTLSLFLLHQIVFQILYTLYSLGHASISSFSLEVLALKRFSRCFWSCHQEYSIHFYFQKEFLCRLCLDC